MADWRSQHVLAKCVENIGEAASRLGPQVQQAYPEVPWHLIRGMRNRLTHGYDEISLPLLWRTVKNSLPSLQAHIEKIMRAEGVPLPDPVASSESAGRLTGSSEEQRQETRAILERPLHPQLSPERGTDLGPER